MFVFGHLPGHEVKPTLAFRTVHLYVFDRRILLHIRNAKG